MLSIAVYCWKNSDEIAYIYQFKRHQLWFNPYCHQPTDLLGRLMGEFCNKISARRVPIMIRSLLRRMVYYEPVQINRCTWAGGNNFWRCNLTPRSLRVNNQDSVFTSKFGPLDTIFELDCGYHLPVSCKVINPRSRLSSEQAIYNRSLFAGSLRLCAWIWSSFGRFDSIAYTLRLFEVMANLSPPDLVRFRV